MLVEGSRMPPPFGWHRVILLLDQIQIQILVPIPTPASVLNWKLDTVLFPGLSMVEHFTPIIVQVMM